MDLLRNTSSRGHQPSSSVMVLAGGANFLIALGKNATVESCGENDIISFVALIFLKFYIWDE